MPPNLLEVIGEGERSLSNQDIASLYRAEYNERYFKYQPGYRERSQVGDHIIEYRDQDLFKFETGTIVERGYGNKSGQYNDVTASYIHHILIEEITKNLIDKIQSNMYRSDSLREYLSVPARGAAAPIDIRIKVEHYPRIQVVITGPFWLRFFYYGRRAFTIHGRPENTAARGKLVFYDPQSLDKIVTSEVHMKRIPPGLWVEKAVAEIKNQLSSAHFLDRYFPSYDEKEYLIENFQRQLGRLQSDTGHAALDLINLIKKPAKEITPEDLKHAARRLEGKQRQALEQLRQAVSVYRAKGAPEGRADKQLVYKALREYVNNVHVNIASRGDLLSELPSNLAVRSTAKKILS